MKFFHDNIFLIQKNILFNYYKLIYIIFVNQILWEFKFTINHEQLGLNKKLRRLQKIWYRENKFDTFAIYFLLW